MNLTTQARSEGSTLPSWMIAVGAVVAVVGGIVMAVAANQRKHAAGVNAFSRAMGNPFDDPKIAAAVTLGHWGLGLLIFGAVVAVLGVTALAVRR